MRGERGSQDAIVRVDGEAIDAEFVAGRGLCRLDDCDAKLANRKLRMVTSRVEFSRGGIG